jgi:tryptophan halogenase
MEDSGSQRIRRVVIVGGGTAGWMAALHLNRTARAQGASVTLIESAALGAIGVGEATIPSLVQFLRALKLDERAFMRRCSATIKLGVRFDGWVEDGVTHWHPFGVCGARVDNLDLFHFWLKHRSEVDAKSRYADFSLQVALANREKAAWPFDGASAVWRNGAYAYHLDAAAMAGYFRELATREGVQHLFGDIRAVERAENGDIAALDIGGDRRIAGDLFVDATGFAGLMIEQALGDPWIDWSDQMLCDHAVAMPLPRGEAFPPYTRSSAAPAGWIWRIPLSSRTGVGYVFSSAFVPTDEAIATLIARADLRRARTADPRLIRFRVGRRTHFWLRNCVSVGLSCGFVEPLESTGIHMIQKAVAWLADFWPDRGFNPALAKAFNARMGDLMNEARDFILLHYLVNRRDEPFWRAARAAPLPDTLRETLALYDETGRIQSPRLSLFPETSYYFILEGAGRLPRRLIPEAAAARPDEIGRMLGDVRAENHRFLERMPSHADYLARLHQVAL